MKMMMMRRRKRNRSRQVPSFFQWLGYAGSWVGQANTLEDGAEVEVSNSNQPVVAEVEVFIEFMNIWSRADNTTTEAGMEWTAGLAGRSRPAGTAGEMEGMVSGMVGEEQQLHLQ